MVTARNFYHQFGIHAVDVIHALEIKTVRIIFYSYNMEVYKLIRKYRCIMTLKECPICHMEVDKRGYTQHIRKCKEIQENKEVENMETKEVVNEPQNVVGADPEHEESHANVNSKNSKSPKLIKVIASVAGLIVVLIISILMLISPKSKDSIPEKSANKFHKNHLNR